MSVKVHHTINELLPDQWNSLVMDNNPFNKWEFYHALEVGNCIGKGTGWSPLYFVAFNEEKTLQACSVLFLKTDSYGEFIFDWDWAQAYQQYQIPYYPKLTCAIPFSPITAPKLLGDEEVIQTQLVPEIWSFYQKNDFSGLHFLFTEERDDKLLQGYDLSLRDSFQYHWHNTDLKSFDEYLLSLSKNRRKSIKRERRDVSNLSLDIVLKRGKEISSEDLDFFFECYLTTIDKKWSQAYLTKEFFKQLFTTMPEHCLLFIASDEVGPAASSLFLQSETTLFGRYWGCIREHEFLHFELCLYRGLDYAIENKLKVFEAGAQGEHKRIRGFSPLITHSLHHLKHPQFNAAIKDFMLRERQGIKELFDKHF